jgi:hypothetical protein
MRTTDRLPETTAAPAGAPLAVTLPVRVVGAGLLLAMGGIHFYLWQTGYKTIHLIGPAFLANAVLGVLVGVAVLVAARRWLAWVCLLGALLEIGTLGALLLSLTVGLFGFVESWSAPLVMTTILVEAAGFLVLGGFAAQQLLTARFGNPRRSGRQV